MHYVHRGCLRLSPHTDLPAWIVPRADGLARLGMACTYIGLHCGRLRLSRPSLPT